MAGIEPVEAGYKRFRVKPLIGKDLTYAKAHIDTAYGVAGSEWHIKDSVFTIDVDVTVLNYDGFTGQSYNTFNVFCGITALKNC